MTFARSKVIALILLAGTLDACMRPGTVTVTHVSIKGARSGPIEQVTRDRFRIAVRAALPEVARGRRDEEIDKLGEVTCDGIRDGRTPAAITRDLTTYRVPAPASYGLITLAWDGNCD